MKKRITIFVVLIMTMVICLAFTGCGQNTSRQDEVTNDSHPVENPDTGGSSIIDRIQNPSGIVQSDDDSYADDAAKEREAAATNESHPNENPGTSGSSIVDRIQNPGGIVQSDDDSYADDAAKERENTAANESGAGQNFSGEYSWQVGSDTLTTKINIMDYIDGDVWHANEMAAALGWDPIAMKIDGSYATSMRAKKPATYRSNGLLIYYSDAGSWCNGISGHIEHGDLVFSIAVGKNGEYSYRMNDADFYWSMEEIVCFAYAMENMPSNNDPFANVLQGNRSSYVIE